MTSVQLILASASSRRRDLLAELDVPFEVRPSMLDEPRTIPTGVSARAWAAALAHYKARSVQVQLPPDESTRWILGADTLVTCGDEILGKPRDVDDARRMLLLQAGNACEVITGVCLLRGTCERTSSSRRIGMAITRVWMRCDFAEIERYVASGDWEGKAGAYGIQDSGDRLIDRIEGSFSNVVGLPMELLARWWADRIP